MESSRECGDKDECIPISYVDIMQSIRKWRRFKQQHNLAAIDGEILAVDFYLTLSHRVLYKEVKFQAIHDEKIGGNIMLVKFLHKGTSHNRGDLEE